MEIFNMTPVSTSAYGQSTDSAKPQGSGGSRPASSFAGGAAGAIDAMADRAKAFTSNADSIVHDAKDRISEAASATGDMAMHAKDKAQEIATSFAHGANQAMHTSAEALTRTIRRYPVQSVLVGVALGYLLVRVTSRRS
jgi:hypothetical protein